MTDIQEPNDDVIDVEVGDEDVTDTTLARPFYMVTHKTSLARYFGHLGVEQHFGVNVNPATAPISLWWCSQDWAAQAATAGIELPQLLAPTPGFVARLDKKKWLKRDVGHLRKSDIPSFYAKHPDYLVEHPQVILSTGGEHTELIPPAVCTAEDLAAGNYPAPYNLLPGDVFLQLDQPLPCVIEVRYWVANGELTAACPYRLGMVGWDSNFFLEMLFNEEGRLLVGMADEVAGRFANEVDGPPGYAFDLGITTEGTVTVLRAWPSWAADPLAAEPMGVWTSIVAAHDFDQMVDLDVWRWDPDQRIYDRSIFADTETEPEPETDEREEDAHHA